MQGSMAQIGRDTTPTTPPRRDMPELSPLLTSMPPDATLGIWLKPHGSVIPKRVSVEHVSDVLAQGETVLLVSFSDVTGDIWPQMREVLDHGKALEIPVLTLIGSEEKNFLSSAIFGARGRTAAHRRAEVQAREVVFSPSGTLAQLLGIQRKGMIRTHNALILVHDHKVVARWVDPLAGDPDAKGSMHEWEGIEMALARTLTN